MYIYIYIHIYIYIYGMSSSQLTNSYFSEGLKTTTNQISNTWPYEDASDGRPGMPADVIWSGAQG